MLSSLFVVVWFCFRRYCFVSHRCFILAQVHKQVKQGKQLETFWFFCCMNVCVWSCVSVQHSWLIGQATVEKILRQCKVRLFSFSWLKKAQETRTFRSLSAMRWLVVLECVARFLFEETNLHVALVPLLPVCRALAAWNTSLQDLLDNTIRVVAQYQLAFAVGPTAVTSMVRTGRRARRMPRRGHPEAVDMEFLAERGFLPEEVLNTMQLRDDVVCSADRKVLPHCKWVFAHWRGGGHHYIPRWTPGVLEYVCNHPFHRRSSNWVRNFLWQWKRGAVLSHFVWCREGCFYWGVPVSFVCIEGWLSAATICSSNLSVERIQTSSGSKTLVSYSINTTSCIWSTIDDWGSLQQLVVTLIVDTAPMLRKCALSLRWHVFNSHLPLPRFRYPRESAVHNGNIRYLHWCISERVFLWIDRLYACSRNGNNCNQGIMKLALFQICW